jgi:hypothetical protein
MFRRKALLVGGFVAVLVLGGLVGYGFGQTGLLYPYLPAMYSAPYTPSLAEWRALYLTATWGGEQYLTDRLKTTSALVGVLTDGMHVLVATDTQPSWNTYLGNGRFSSGDREVKAAYMEAAGAVMQMVRRGFPEIPEGDVEISFGIRGSSVGTWRGGVLKLQGE